MHLPSVPVWRRGKSDYALTPLASALLMILQSVQGALAQDEFDMAALETSGPKMSVDLSQFANPGSQLPGAYHVTIFVNHQQVDARILVFIQNGQGQLTPVVTPQLLKQWGVKVDAIATLPGAGEIKNIPAYIPDSQVRLDYSQLRLDLTIPQANLDTTAQGSVNPALWDDGIPALLVGYDFNGSNTWREDDQSGHEDNYFLNLHSGLNAGAWRLRNYSTWTYSKSPEPANPSSDFLAQDAFIRSSTKTENRWHSLNTFLQRDVQPIQGLLTLGDATTPTDVYDGFSFRGAQLASNDEMIPDSLRNFAPTVRGIAASNATVTIRQNNSVIYQKQVPAGPFAITDLYPNNTNGDLQVTVKESDGQEHSFIQPFSSVAIMQREGHLKYSVTGGKYRSNSSGKEPYFTQMSLIYGLPHDLTLYGGTQFSNSYKNGLGGIGVTLADWGAVSIDGAYSSAQLTTGEQKNGESYRVQYSKSMLSTGSTLTLAAYRFSSKGYYSFQDAADLSPHADTESDTFDVHHNKRSRWQASLSQSLPTGWGTFYINGYQQDYWGESGDERNLAIGYSNSWQGITYSFNYNFTGSPGSENDHQAALSVNVPLDRWLRNAYAGYTVNSNRHGDAIQQMSLYGTALKANNLSYSIMQGYQNHKESGTSGNATINYIGSAGEVSGGYNYDANSHQINYGLQGSIIAHQHGITLSQALNQDIQSIALVRSPGLDGVNIENGTGLRTDWRGYAVVPYLTPYRETTVRLDTSTLADNADVENNTARVVPTAGAVVLADFKTHIGARVLMHLQHSGSALPFGATATLVSDTTVSGIVNDNGDVYLTGMPLEGELIVQWDTGKTHQCHASYRLPEQSLKTVGVLEMATRCQ